MKYPRLFVGPMSKEIVDISCEYSRDKEILGLIPSRRQIENTGGYVNNWNTKEFCKYVRSLNSDVIITRDHGGPSQGQVKDDGLKSFDSDIQSGFDILHIDPWKTCKTNEEGIEKTKDLILYCSKRNSDLSFEVGTEESIFPYEPEDLNYMLTKLRDDLLEKFNLIKFAVVQSGVKISGTKNIGNFDPRRLEKMIKIIDKFSLLSKEHNGDYLSFNDIHLRAKIGLDSINIAPEFGVTQTRILLAYSDISFEDALTTCIKSKKFEKWIPDDLMDNPPNSLVVEVSGHYNFTKHPFLKNLSLTTGELRKKLFYRFDEIHEAWA